MAEADMTAQDNQSSGQTAAAGLTTQQQDCGDDAANGAAHNRANGAAAASALAASCILVYRQRDAAVGGVHQRDLIDVQACELQDSTSGLVLIVQQQGTRCTQL
jgi:hypothetical protein